MADEPDLSPGTSSEWVLYLQQLLNHHYQQAVVPENGEFDETTEHAVRHFREQNQLAEGATVDTVVWAGLLGRSATGDAPGTGIEPGIAAADWPQARSVRVWVKAFVPGDCAGTVDGTGAAAGRRVLNGPSDWFTGSLGTDDRGFSLDPAATCRMHSELRLDLGSGQLGEVHYCDEIAEYDPATGQETDRDTPDTSRMSWTDLRQDGRLIRIDLVGFADNPCTAGSADLAYHGTVTIDFAAHTVSFSGAVAAFPAYEAYAAVDDGAAEPLFRYGPSGGADTLVSGPTEAVSGTAAF